MPMLYQPFDGAPGEPVNWTTTEATGAPLGEYLPGGSTATYIADAIRGAASAQFTTTAGTNTAQVSAGVIDQTTVRAHVYVRTPAKIATAGQIVLGIIANGGQVHVVIDDDLSCRLESWGALIGTAAPAGTLPAGGVFRVGMIADGTGAVRAAVWEGHDTEPLWETSGPYTLGNLSEVVTGIPWAHTTTDPLTVVIDDLRVETAITAGTGWLPPEVVPSARRWVREPVGWRALNEAYAVEERWTAPAGLGARRPGTVPDLTVPSGAIHVAVGGSDTGSGSTTAPYATLTRAYQAVQPGGTIVMHAGSHRVGVALPTDGTYNADTTWAGVTAGGKDNVTVTAAPGEEVWLDGSRAVTGWTKVGNVWETPLTIAHDRSPTGSHGADDNPAVNWNYLRPDNPSACWPEQVWIDGVEQRQVTSRDDVVPGTFCVEGTTAGAGGKVWVSSKYVLGTDPTSRAVRVVDLATCLSSPGSGFTLRGVGVRRYGAGVPARGAVKFRHPSCLMEDVTFDRAGTLSWTGWQASNSTLRRVTVRGAGMLGLECTESDDVTTEDCLVTGANTRGFNHVPESAGLKYTHLRRPIFRRVTVHDSDCHGIWLDESVAFPRVVGCDVHWVDGKGIVSELCHGTVIADCVVTGTGDDAVTIHNTSGEVVIGCCTLARPGRLSPLGRCVSIISDDRAPLTAGSIGLDPRFGFPHPDGVDALTVDVTIADNILGPSRAGSLVFNQDFTPTGRGWEKHGIKLRSNQYVTFNGGPEWKWVVENDGTGDPTILWSMGELSSVSGAAGPLETGSAQLPGRDYGTDLHGRPTPRAGREKPVGVPIPDGLAALTGLTAGDTTQIGARR